MNGKLKKVIELANQLQEAVDMCTDDLLSVTIRKKTAPINSGIHIYNPAPGDFEGMKFERQDDDGGRWFSTDAYGVPIFGVVRGGGDQ